MKHQLRTGVSFGLTSGIITTLGLMVGLHSGTQSRIAVIGGILTIAIADAFSDALGIHISEESENQHTHKEIWESTIYTFLSKFFIAISFLALLLSFELTKAIIVSIVWGMFLLVVFNFYIAKTQKKHPWKVIGEHLAIATLVIILTHFLGDLIHSYLS